MLWNYSKGYENSVSWEVTTTADIIDFPAMIIDNGFIPHQIMGEKYLLEERYSGSRIERNLLSDQIYLGLIWLGMCLFLALSTSFGRYSFFAVMAGFALFINRLNLFEVGLFGINSKLVMLIPFILFLVPLVYFHEYRKDSPLLMRLASLLVVTVVLCLGINDAHTFADHFIAHSIFGFAIVTLIFIFLISEELLFLFLYAVTSTKGGKSNHLHFALISLIYLSNLGLYYFNKSGIYENSFFFFDPYILLTISTLVALWSIRFKDQAFSNLVPAGLLSVVVCSLGIIAFMFMSMSMNRGMDMIHQSFHYFILYSHLGLGVFFFLYVISNFLDPFITGFELYKIAYRERNFPYATARLGGLVVVAAFFFLSGQEAYNLLRSGYYAYLSEKESHLENTLLSKEYLINSEFLGFNTHYPNYKLAWMEWDAGNEFRAKSNFFNATQRFPSPFAWVNYGNLESEDNPNKVRAVYEESLRRLQSPEMENNLGVIHLHNGEIAQALEYFEDNESSNQWNEAPILNKWKALSQAGTLDSLHISEEYDQGNFGVKANIISSLQEDSELNFEFTKLNVAPPLHREAYLINSSHLFDHDSIEAFLRKEMEGTMSSSTSVRLANALAIYLYKKGEVNKSFRLIDEMQANTNEVYKGKYFDILGKLSLDQGSYRLAEEFFTKAIRSGYAASRINRLEAFAAQDKQKAVTDELIRILENSPELTDKANGLLEVMESFVPKRAPANALDLNEMPFDELVSKASRNAFDESLILDAVSALNQRDSVMAGYDILVEAIEINPYSPSLLQEYILLAIDWNLVSYADQSMEQLQERMSIEDYQHFSEEIRERKEASLSDEW